MDTGAAMEKIKLESDAVVEKVTVDAVAQMDVDTIMDEIKMDPDAILEKLKSNGVIWLKHAHDTFRPTGHLLGGIVTDIEPTKKPGNGTDHKTTLTLLEPSSIKSEGKKINIFHSESIMPIGLKKGDIFLCKGPRSDMKYKNFTSTKLMPWAGFDVDTLDRSCEGDASMTCDDTIIEILGLYQTWVKTAQPLSLLPSSAPTPTPTPTLTRKLGTGRREIVTTEKMEQWKFIDYVGMVVRCDKSSSETNTGNKTNLRLTDYTPNMKPIMLSFKERKNTLVPIDMLINCTLYDENSRDCPSTLGYGDYVYIKNATCKLDFNGSMEIVVRHDEKPSSVRIWQLDENDPLIAEIKRLRLAYESMCEREREEAAPPPTKGRKNYKIRTVGGTARQDYSFIKDVMLQGNWEVAHNLRVYIIDYKPKIIANISVKFCDACRETSNINATQCKKCGTKVDKIAYRCLLQFKDMHGDILNAAIYGTDEEPIFHKVPVVNLKENKEVCDQVAEYMNALCPPDQQKGPMLDMSLKVYVYEGCLRFVIENTKYRLDLE